MLWQAVSFPCSVKSTEPWLGISIYTCMVSTRKVAQPMQRESLLYMLVELPIDNWADHDKQLFLLCTMSGHMYTHTHIRAHTQPGRRRTSAPSARPLCRCPLPHAWPGTAPGQRAPQPRPLPTRQEQVTSQECVALFKARHCRNSWG